ncbi:hypothetical protein CPB85DRAFT_1253238 [Mucidula mucida]|nr:hypothetical protein CPB85DRAFT_1253238 [Mucidula mucida]
MQIARDGSVDRVLHRRGKRYRYYNERFSVRNEALGNSPRTPGILASFRAQKSDFEGKKSRIRGQNKGNAGGFGGFHRPKGGWAPYTGVKNLDRIRVVLRKRGNDCCGGSWEDHRRLKPPKSWELGLFQTFGPPESEESLPGPTNGGSNGLELDQVNVDDALRPWLVNGQYAKIVHQPGEAHGVGGGTVEVVDGLRRAGSNVPRPASSGFDDGILGRVPLDRVVGNRKSTHAEI